MEVKKFVAHSKMVLSLSGKFGWQPGARYTNLRDIKHLDKFEECFIDIDWKGYDFKRHLAVVKETRPLITVARDITNKLDLEKILLEAEELSDYAKHIILVPKDKKLNGNLSKLIPNKFILGFSVPTKYGNTNICPKNFDMPVHLLGGRPDVQRALANKMPVISLDCNRFTYDARFGDHFDGETFRPHPKGGYKNCIRSSIKNINTIWKNYRAPLFEW